MEKKTMVSVFLFFSLFELMFSLSRKHIYVKEKMIWTDAQKYCREHHDDLSTITNFEEAQQLSQNPEVTDSFYWVGLQRNPQDLKKWIWSGGEEATVVYWSDGEGNTEDEHCALVKKSSSKMHDNPCSIKMPFYCMEVLSLILVQQNKTWEEALDYCRQNYIDLASVISESILAEVINNIMTAQTAHVWTGLRFLAGHWFWVSGDNLEYKAWSVGGELQCPAINLCCGAVDRVEKVWKPKDCEETLNFVCHKIT